MRLTRIISTIIVGCFAANSYATTFGMPVACDYGKTCFIQNYVDTDAGPGAADYKCGRLTYGGHKGTDFRLTDFAAMQRGVNVLAAADGTVLRLRNDAPDTGLDAGSNAVAKVECGNGLVIAHADGFETQYCHLKRGSIGVHTGDLVKVGDVLGQIGYSGQTEFPHVHFQVSQHGQIIDPFNSTRAACGGEPHSLWHAQTKLPYIATAILGAGFSDAVPAPDKLTTPRTNVTTLAPSAPVLTLWTSIMGTQQGDQLHMVITAPDGTILAEKRETIAKSQATAFRYIGKKNRTPLAKGAYTGSIILERNGTQLMARSSTLMVAAP